MGVRAPRILGPLCSGVALPVVRGFPFLWFVRHHHVAGAGVWAGGGLVVATVWVEWESVGVVRFGPRLRAGVSDQVHGVAAAAGFGGGIRQASLRRK